MGAAVSPDFGPAIPRGVPPPAVSCKLGYPWAKSRDVRHFFPMPIRVFDDGFLGKRKAKP
jgi:hypothetical protein